MSERKPNQDPMPAAFVAILRHHIQLSIEALGIQSRVLRPDRLGEGIPKSRQREGLLLQIEELGVLGQRLRIENETYGRK